MNEKMFIIKSCGLCPFALRQHLPLDIWKCNRVSPSFRIDDNSPKWFDTIHPDCPLEDAPESWRIFAKEQPTEDGKYIFLTKNDDGEVEESIQPVINGYIPFSQYLICWKPYHGTEVQDA